MQLQRFAFCLAALLGCISLLPASAQEDFAPAGEQWGYELVDHTLGPIEGRLRNQAVVDVPDGYVFLDRAATQALMTQYGNLLTEQESGLIHPAQDDWFLIFDFDEVGFVKDDDKNDLDANEILEFKREGQEYANQEYERMGMEKIYVTGWAIEPRYNEDRKFVEWAMALRTESGEKVVNHEMRILGRQGVMKATLVCGPDQLDAVLPEVYTLLEGFEYVPGRTYADFKDGDKIAEYGLKGLIAGGAVFALAKTGILQKLLKPIIIGVVAIGGVLAKFKGKIFGRRATT